MYNFEKGIRPIKAKKFYYFKKSMAKELANLEISHNDIGEIERGTWRKYNPYNPYVEESDKNPVKDLKVESLDDLFEENVENEKTPVVSEIKEDSKMSVNKLADNDEAPVLPMSSDPDEEYDLQKELEAKFDELFGPIDDNDDN